MLFYQNHLYRNGMILEILLLQCTKNLNPPQTIDLVLIPFRNYLKIVYFRESRGKKKVNYDIYNSF
jgi:hypothetical protein